MSLLLLYKPFCLVEFTYIGVVEFHSRPNTLFVIKVKFRTQQADNMSKINH